MSDSAAAAQARLKLPAAGRLRRLLPAGDRLRRLLPALWAGVLLAVAGIATPAAFATLARPEAAQVVAWVLAREAWLSLVLGLLLLMLARGRALRAQLAGQGSVLSTEMLLALGTLFCTVVGYFAIQPMMPAARLGQGAFSFGQLHLASTVFYAAKLVCVLALAWRAAASQVLIQPAPDPKH